MDMKSCWENTRQSQHPAKSCPSLSSPLTCSLIRHRGEEGHGKPSPPQGSRDGTQDREHPKECKGSSELLQSRAWKNQVTAILSSCNSAILQFCNSASLHTPGHGRGSFHQTLTFSCQAFAAAGAGEGFFYYYYFNFFFKLRK